MTRRVYTMLTSGGEKYHAHLGMVDENGAFVCLVEQNKSKYFKFSDEADLLDVVFNDNDMLMDENDELCQRIVSIEKRYMKARAEITELKCKLKEANIEFESESDDEYGNDEETNGA